MRLVPSLDRSRSGPVARFMLRANVRRVGVLWDTGNAMREVVEDPNDPWVGSLGFVVFDGRRRLGGLPTGDHVAFTG